MHDQFEGMELESFTIMLFLLNQLPSHGLSWIHVKVRLSCDADVFLQSPALVNFQSRWTRTDLNRTSGAGAVGSMVGAWLVNCCTVSLGAAELRPHPST